MKRKLNWLFFLDNERGEVGGGDEPSIHSAFMEALDKPEETPPPETPPAETPPETPPAWDKVERRKVYAGEKRRAEDKAVDDPEFEMDFEPEAGKGKLKLKAAQLKAMAKELFENKNSYNYGRAMMDAGTKHPEFRTLIDKVVAMSFKDLKDFQPENVTKILAQLEGKAEKVEEQVEEKDALIDEMQSQLEDLDPDSPQAGILKKSIAYQKGLKAQFQKQLGEGQKRIDALEAKLNGVEKTHKDFLSEQDKAESAVEVKRLSGVYDKEIGALTASDNKDGYKFSDDDERKEFDMAVRNSVAANSANIKDDESFVKLIQGSAKAVYEKMALRRESWVNGYLKKKGQVPKKEDELPKKKEDEKDPNEGKTMGEILADNFFG